MRGEGDWNEKREVGLLCRVVVGGPRIVVAFTFA